MKQTFLFLLVGLSIVFTNCKDKNDPAPDARKKILTTWMVKNGGYVKRDGTLITSLDNFEITFLDNNKYTSTGGTTTDFDQKVFLSEGIWKWENEQGTSILRDDISPQVSDLTETTVTLKFTLDEDNAGAINGRANSVIGNYEIKLIKK
jgi:hypothetical protein